MSYCSALSCKSDTFSEFKYLQANVSMWYYNMIEHKYLSLEIKCTRCCLQCHINDTCPPVSGSGWVINVNIMWHYAHWNTFLFNVHVYSIASLSYHITQHYQSCKWFMASIGCCLTAASGLSKTLFYLETWPHVPQHRHYPLSFQMMNLEVIKL